MSKTDDNLARLDARDKGKSSDPMDYLAIGLFVEVLGGSIMGFGLAADEVLAVVFGAVVAAVGSVVLLIGVVAQGVLVGVRASRQD